MRYDDLPVFELTVMFAAPPKRARAVLEAAAELVCRETGGTGEGETHVCGGFHCAWFREIPGGLLEEVS